MDLSTANSLSKFLIITVALWYRSLTLTLSLESCGHIGDNSETRYSAYDGDGFYLDVGNRACCSGNITSWRVCYYMPEGAELRDSDLYRVKYAVYRRRNDTDYIQVSNVTFNFTLGREGSSNINDNRQKRDGSTSKGPMEPFNCYDMPLNKPFAVRACDIIGACVVSSPAADHSEDPNYNDTISNVHKLNVVSDLNNQSQTPHSDSGLYLTSCQMNEALPAAIDIAETQFSYIRSRRLHISANIMNSKYNVKLLDIIYICHPIKEPIIISYSTMINLYYTGTDVPTTNETMRQTPCLNINATQTESMETLNFTCSPPANERSSDGPARRRQHRAYQAIMNSRRIRQICDRVSV